MVELNEEFKLLPLLRPERASLLSRQEFCDAALRSGRRLEGAKSLRTGGVGDEFDDLFKRLHIGTLDAEVSVFQPQSKGCDFTAIPGGQQRTAHFVDHSSARRSKCLW